MSIVVPARADVVVDWNELMLDAIRADTTGPTVSTRHLAIMNTAIYDAVNSVTRGGQPYRFQLPLAGEASAEAAAVAAGYETFVLLYPGLAAWGVDLYASYLAAATPSTVQSNGLVLGRTIAWLAVDARSADGSNTEVPYIPSSAAGEWQRTPPFFRPPLTPHWRWVKPFGLPEVESFVPGSPPALDSPEYAAALNEVKAIGGKTSRVRTAAQSQIAVFWSDFSYTAMPPGHWHEIAAAIVRARQSPLEENARLFALLSVATADAAIVCWEAKYRYNVWRPITAIARAQEDGNAATEPEPGWDHLLAAPPFPAYPSGHSTFSGAAAAVLATVLGTDAIEFTVTSDSLPGVTRHFTSLAACAEEVGLSRIYGGIHFPFDNTAGKECGRKMGYYIAQNLLLPQAMLPRLTVERALPGAVAVRVHAHLGEVSVLEQSMDLRQWSPVATNQAVLGGWIFHPEISAEAQSNAAFFRVWERSLPLPE